MIMSLNEDSSDDEDPKIEEEKWERFRQIAKDCEDNGKETESSRKKQRVDQVPFSSATESVFAESSSSPSSSKWNVIPVSGEIERPKELRINEFVKEEEFIYFCHPDYDKASLSKKTCMVGFDMDGCLIDTKSGRTFPTDYVTDWRLWHATKVAAKLRDLHESGAYLCIISNQGGIDNGKVAWTEVEPKIRGILDTLGVPMDFICCHRKPSLYRKPSIGAWQLMQKHRCPSAIKGESSYVGDAAGRPARGGGRKKDFSDTDYKLALNLGISFFTPERFFLDDRSPYHCNLPAPAPFTKLSTCSSSESSFEVEKILWPGGAGGAKEIVLLVAPAGTGKTTLAQMMQSRSPSGDECVVVNQDTLGTRPRCLAAAESAISMRRAHIIVDNTNLSPTIRAEWVQLANRHGYKIRCIYLRTEKEVALTQVVYRLLSPDTPEAERREISAVTLNTHYKNVFVPSVSEGFSRVDEVPWSPRPPASSPASLLFDMYLR